MIKAAIIGPDDQHYILSSLSPGQAQRRLALAVVFGLLVVFVVITFGSFSNIQLGRSDAFVPAYTTAMFVNDSITAILLFAQFSIVRSRSILVIASGYLFTALILIPWVLAFPGVLATKGLIGGLQSTAWLYFFWHGGFALFVLGYAASKDGAPDREFWKGTRRTAISLSVALTATVVAAVTFLCIARQEVLPHVVLDTLRFSPLWPYWIGAPVAALSIGALIVLWVRRRSMLDLWLMVVMCAYLVEQPLSYYPVPSRFSVGWYAVRIIGFLSSSLVLIVLLHEITTLYARLLGAVLAQRREREARLRTGDAVSATIAHEVRQPLTAMITSADAGLRFLERSEPNIDKAKEAFGRVVADGHRAGEVINSIRAIFKSDVRNRTSLDVNELIRDALALARADLQKHQIVVQAEPNRQIPTVRGDRVQLQQVLLNLITNAIDAMATEDEPRILCVRTEPLQDDGVRVSVADTGMGIATHDMEKIFTPLFTTKAEGMGMGLSICRSIIEAHAGRFSVAPNNPRGAVFQFTLRATSAMAQET
jgi:signal transduction histidine kinase